MLIRVYVSRRAFWLQLIARRDLGDKESRNFTVCEAHFHSADIVSGSSRRTLRKHSVPQLHLPPEGKIFLPSVRDTKDCFTQMANKYVASSGCQTDSSFVWMPLFKKKCVQPLADLPTERTVEVKPLTAQVALVKQERCDTDDLEEFYYLCDKLLTSDLAELAKLQAILKLQNKIK